VGDAAGGIAKIADFGCAKDVNFQETQTFIIGTFMYFAPEKIDEDYDEKVDVWAMAIVLYEMLTGGESPLDYDFGPQKLKDYIRNFPTHKLKPMPSFISEPC